MTLIDGKSTAAAIKAEIAEEVKRIVEAGGKRPHLAAILVGHDGGSETYVKNKVLACEACGFTSTLLRFEDNITEAFLLEQVDKLNKDADVKSASFFKFLDIMSMSRIEKPLFPRILESVSPDFTSTIVCVSVENTASRAGL